MKIWTRYLLGGAVGLLLGAVLPMSGGDTAAVLDDVTQLVIRVGRLALFPMVFFAAIVATDKLQEEQRLLPVVGAMLGVSLLATTVATTIGAASIAVFQPQRIPPMIQEGRVPELPDLFPTLLDAVPGNLFQVFVAGENALLILAVLGVVFGLALRFDREITSPVSLVAESANRVLYRVNGWIVEIMGVLLIAPGALAIAELRGVEDLRIFAPLLIVVVSAALFTALVVYPIVLLVVNRNRNRPLAWLQHMIPVGFSALMGADVFFALGTTTRIAAENLGLTRRAGALVLPGAALFCRAGSALVSVSAFLVVVRSYTALELGFADAMQLIVAGVLYSTILVRYPTGAVVLLLGYLAGRYGEGMEESYLILLPVIPVLERIAAWLDAMTTGFIAELIGRRGGYTREIERTI